MKRLLAALLAWLVLPGLAHAADATLVARELPVGAVRSLAGVTTPSTFDLVGLHWQGSGAVSFRTRSLAGRWSAWHAAAPEAEDLPDARSSEAAAGRAWRLGNPYWTGDSDRIEYRVAGVVSRLKAYFVWSPVTAIPYRTTTIAGTPQIVPRAGWSADDRILRGPPVYASAVKFAVVHHTAGSNDYGPLQSAAIVRGIELYHVQGNGWKDIGYNFLVDRYGQVFEGRFGGIDRNVIGAHAEGFNTGSVGVALLGNYTSQAISPAAEQALGKLLAWRLDVAHVDPLSTLTVTSGGNARFPAGAPVFLRAVSGHRDTGFTTCPGNRLYVRLNAIAGKSRSFGLPKLYAPGVEGKLGGPVRFSARLSTALRWSVTVATAAGRVVALGAGTGTAISWTWDATTVLPGRYTWTIDAGPTVRPASGTIRSGSAPPPPTPTPPPPPPPKEVLAGLEVSPPAVSPNGDGFADTATASYVLGVRSSVTAVVQDAAGVVLTTLFSAQTQSARRIAFALPADQLADGRYTLAITATADDGRSATASAPFLVDRTLSALTALPSPFSSNGGTIAFAFALAKPAHVTVVVSRAGKPLAVAFEGALEAGPQSITWSGALPGGPLPDGHYDVAVTAADDVGEISQSAGFDVASG